jgi:dodecin
MAGRTFRLVELVGSSTSSTDDAIRQSIETAAKTLRYIASVEVTKTRGHVVEAKFAHFQVVSSVGICLAD